MPPPLTLKDHPRVALVLGSGGAKGFAHIGVLQVLKDEGIPVDLIVGCSAGSAVGALYADNGDVEQATRAMLTAGFWDFADVANIPTLKGAIQGYRFQKFLMRNMRSRWFNEMKIPMVVAATDLRNGEMVALSSGPIPPAVVASAAIPGAVLPINLYGHTLVDGGMTDPVPVDIAERYHPDVIIAVDVTAELPNEMPTTAVGVYRRAFLISWIKLTALAYKKADVTIHPHVGQTGTFSLGEKWDMVEAGREATREALPKIREALAKHHIDLERTHAALQNQKSAWHIPIASHS